MNWQKYNSNEALITRRGRGLSGMNMDAITTSKATIADSQRQFGTELSNNIVANEGIFHQRLSKKRTFDQLHDTNGPEKKEEESVPVEGEEDESHPSKRRRYNLRSSQARTRPADQKENVQTSISQDGETDDEEDIDLESNRANNQQHKPSITTGAQRKTTNKHKLRRSQRLKNKRERRLQIDHRDSKAIKVKAMAIQSRPKLEIITESPSQPMDCDADKEGDDLFCPQYAGDICAWYREVEESSFQRSLIRSNYISTRFQPDLNDSMRVILLNWLFNVHRRFQLNGRVIYLTVYILDAYLSLVPVRRDQLQLVGCSALWIASKYHEIYAPEVTDFVFISDHSFEVEDLFQMEVQILVQLEFKFADIMTPLHFLERFLQIATHPLMKKYETRGTAKALKDGKRYVSLVSELSQFFCHLILFDCKMVSSKKPSLMAASALCFTVLSISLYTKWPEFLIEATGYEHDEMKPVIKRMNELRSYHVSDTVKKEKTMAALRKVHKSIQKWLDRLNINSAVNNGTESS
jgi:hypothetical protein